LFADEPGIVAALDPEVGAQQIDHGEVRGRLPVGHRCARDDEAILDSMGVRELVIQAGLADAGLAHHGHHVAAAWNRDRIAEAPTISYTSIGCARPFTGVGPIDRTSMYPSASARVSEVSTVVPGLASCSMRAARCVVCPTAV